jgi:CRP/FNR family transcriptional regulator, anaerobic regulatory protein
MYTTYPSDTPSNRTLHYSETASQTRVHSAVSSKPLSQLRSGQTLFFEGDPGSDVFLLVKGTICFHRFISGDCRVVLGFSLANEVFSLSLNEKHLCSADAVSDCLFRRLSRAELESMRHNGSGLLEEVTNHLRNEPWRLQFDTLNRLHMTADESVARFICEIGSRSNPRFTNGSRVHLDMSRADIASYLGLTVETVVRSLKRLTASGAMIAFAPHDFGIRDLESLMFHAGSFRQ